jgi:hypothetical protein
MAIRNIPKWDNVDYSRVESYLPPTVREEDIVKILREYLRQDTHDAYAYGTDWAVPIKPTQETTFMGVPVPPGMKFQKYENIMEDTVIFTVLYKGERYSQAIPRRDLTPRLAQDMVKNLIRVQLERNREATAYNFEPPVARRTRMKVERVKPTLREWASRWRTKGKFRWLEVQLTQSDGGGDGTVTCILRDHSYPGAKKYKWFESVIHRSLVKDQWRKTVADAIKDMRKKSRGDLQKWLDEN